MSDKINKITKGISFDKELVKVAKELVPNRSEASEKGLLDETLSRINNLKDEKREAYLKRLSHLIH